MLVVLLVLTLYTCYGNIYSTVTVHPGEDVPKIVQNNPTGTTFEFKPGVYSLSQPIRPKSWQSFVGSSNQNDVTLTGAIVLQCTQQSHQSGSRSLWKCLNDQLKKGSQWRHGVCQTQFPACNYTQDLFVNSVPVHRLDNYPSVQNFPKSSSGGAWFYNYTTGTVFLNFDDSVMKTAKVELSFVGRAFEGIQGEKNISKQPQHVNIKSMTIEKFACASQDGAVKMDGANWVVDNCELRHNHGYSVHLGSNGTIMNSHLHHNGQMGAGGGNSWGQILNNEIDNNNYAGFECGWEAGGVKVALVDQPLLIHNNKVHDNLCDGLWADIGSKKIEYSFNTIYNNEGAGISYEISHEAYIHDNTLWGNGWGNQVWLWNAQIQVQNSEGCVVRNNTVHVSKQDMKNTTHQSAHGIVIVNQDRHPWPQAAHNSITHNTILYDAKNGACGAVADFNFSGFIGAHNLFDYNTYYMYDKKGASEKHWAWVLPQGKKYQHDKTLNFSDFQLLTKNEIHGQVVPGTHSSSS